MRISQARSTTATEESVPSTSGERRQILYLNCNFIYKRTMSFFFHEVHHPWQSKVGQLVFNINLVIFYLRRECKLIRLQHCRESACK